MQNGDAYLNGVGDYDGTNYDEADTLQEVVNKNVSDITTLNSNLYNLDYNNKVDLKDVLNDNFATYTPLKKGVIISRIQSNAQNGAFGIKQHNVTIMYVNLYNAYIRGGSMSIVDNSAITVDIYLNINMEELWFIPFK